MPAKKPDPESFTINQIGMDSMLVRLVGTTPLYIHRMSAKAKRQLMIGGRKKTAAERLEIKHDPRAEFRDCMLVEELKHPHSAIWFPAMAIKSAMGTAALVVPGIRKTDVNRLVFLPADQIPIFGRPLLRMDVMRSSDINRTPDVRTRAFLPEWATELEIRFAKPALSREGVLTLLHNAGIVAGIGDSRQEKGKGSFGSFKIAEPEDEISALLDVDAQLEAVNNPQPHGVESAELLAEFDAEVASRS